jgi:hypothetical protein
VGYQNKYTIISIVSRDSIETTQSALSSKCGLARGNPQWAGILDLLYKCKIPLVQFFCEISSSKIVEYEYQTR